MQHSSRNRIQKAADAGSIYVNGTPVKSNYKVRPNDVITLMLDRPKHDNTIVAEDMPLNVVYEDNEIMVINKPAGLVVHPGAGNFRGTLINAIAWHLRDLKNFDPNDPAVGLARARGRGELDRIEQQHLDFFHRTRARYLELVKDNPKAVMINAEQSIEQVQADIKSAVKNWWVSLSK